MTPGLQRGAALSAGLHVAVLLALIVSLPSAPPPAPPEETAVSVEFSGTADQDAQKGEKQAKVAAPSDADTPATDNPAVKPPEKAPIETAPPPPPPKPVVKPKTAPLKPVESVRAQPNETKNAVPDTSSLDNTMEKLMADQKQVKPPTHRYNAQRGGKPAGGGALHGALTGALSDNQRKQIGAEVRRCYSEDTAARDYGTYEAKMIVTIDANGEARDAQLYPDDMARANSDPAYRAFAERAVRAVLDPVCSKLPVPPDLLGKPQQTLNIRFRP